MDSLKLKHNVMCVWGGQKAFYIEHLERSNVLNSSKMAEFSQVIIAVFITPSLKGKINKVSGS